MCYCFAVSGDKSADRCAPEIRRVLKGKAPRRAARAAARPGHESGSTQKHKNEVGSSSHRSNLCDPCARVSPCVPCLPRPPLPPVSNPLVRPETSDALFVAHFCTPVYILSGQSQCRSTGCCVCRVNVHTFARRRAEQTRVANEQILALHAPPKGRHRPRSTGSHDQPTGSAAVALRTGAFIAAYAPRVHGGSSQYNRLRASPVASC